MAVAWHRSTLAWCPLGGANSKVRPSVASRHPARPGPPMALLRRRRVRRRRVRWRRARLGRLCRYERSPPGGVAVPCGRDRGAGDGATMEDAIAVCRPRRAGRSSQVIAQLLIQAGCWLNDLPETDLDEFAVACPSASGAPGGVGGTTRARRAPRGKPNLHPARRRRRAGHLHRRRRTHRSRPSTLCRNEQLRAVIDEHRKHQDERLRRLEQRIKPSNRSAIIFSPPLRRIIPEN